MEPVGQELQLRDFARTLRKRRGLVLSILSITLLVAALQAFLGTKVYRSLAKIEVQQQSNFIIRSEPSGGGASRLTPATQAEYIRSAPYLYLASAVATLADGYGINLAARRTPEDMYAVIDRDLFEYPLPKYFGHQALKLRAELSSGGGAAGAALSRQYRELAAQSPDAFEPRYITSTEKDEAIKQAGAVAALARRLKLDLFHLPASQIELQVRRIMADPQIRRWSREPLDGKSWQDLPPRERGPALEAVYRFLAEKHPDAVDRKAKGDRLALKELKDPGMLEVGYETWDPERSRLIVTAICDVVIWKNLSALRAEAEGRRRHLEERLWGAGGNGGGMAALLAQTDERFRRMRVRSRTPDPKTETESRATQLTSLREIMDRRAGEIQGMQQEVAELRRSLNNTAPTIVSPRRDENPTLTGVKGALMQAEAELRQAEATYRPDSPRYASLLEPHLAKVRSLRESLAREERSHPTSESTTRSPNPVYQELEKSLATAQAKLQNLIADQKQNQHQYDLLQSALAAIPNQEKQVAGLNRERSVNEEAFKWLAGQYQQALLDEESKQPTARIVDSPLDPGVKVRPKRLTTLALGFILGLILGIGAALFAESQDTRVRTQEQAGRALAGLPVLGAIPQQRTSPQPLALAADGQLPISEAYRSLRSSLQIGAAGGPVRSLVVTSAGVGEGKSTTVANLAVVMARAGAQVIVVDADLRRPSLHRLFGIESEPGLASVLRGSATLEQAVRPTSISGVRLLPCGALPAEPSLLIDSPEMRRVIAELMTQADVVLLDSPAVLPVSDAAVLGSMAEGTLLVLGSGQVARDAASQARALLTQAQARVIGTVLNRADLGRDHPIYTYLRQNAA